MAPLLRSLSRSATVALGLAALGLVPTLHWGGESAVIAMGASCLAAFLAYALGSVPTALVPANDLRARTVAHLAGSGLRFAAALGAGLVLALRSPLETGPLLVWLAASYLALVLAEAFHAHRDSPA